MSYSLLINSKNRIAPAGSPNDATYYFNWAAFQEGKYRVTWSIYRPPVSAFTFNLIDPTALHWYYPFNAVAGNVISNYATGVAVQDASITLANTTVANNRLTMTLSAAATRGVVVNNAVPCSTSPGISFSFWFLANSFQNTYDMLVTLQDALGFNGGRRFFICLNPQNQISFNGNYNSAAVVLNTPYHVAVSILNNNAAVVYLNNVATNTTITSPSSFVNISGRNFLGHDPSPGSGLVGWMQEFRLYNRIITAAEVNTIYTANFNA